MNAFAEVLHLDSTRDLEEQARERAAATAADPRHVAMMAAVAARDWAALCPDNCRGEALQGFQCPLEDTDECHQVSLRRDCSVELALSSIGIPARFRHPDPALVPADIRGYVTDYAKRMGEYVLAGTGLLLLGAPGCGKTSILALLAKRAAKLGIDCRYLSGGGQLYEAIKDNRAREYRECGLFLLDDFDRVTSRGDWAAARLDEFFDDRYAEQRSSVIAGNVTWESLADEVAPKFPQLMRAVSRWKQTMLVAQSASGDQRVPGRE